MLVRNAGLMSVVGMTVLAGASALLACSDDDGKSNASTSSSSSSGSVDADGGATNTQPLFIGSTRIFGSDSSQGYLFTVPSLDAGVNVDLTKAVEITDAWVFGDAKPYFYTATVFEPTITRWTLNADGSFAQGPVISFANLGVKGAYSTAFVPMFSKTKSFFVDSESGQLVMWNPEEMTVLGTVPLDVTKPAGLTGPTDLTPTMDIGIRNDRVFVTIFWMSQSSGWTDFGNMVRVVAIDPATNAIVSSVDDTRTGSAAFGGVATDGTTYIAPWDYHAAVRGVFGGTKGVASSAMKIIPGGMSADQGWTQDLSALVGGKPAGSIFLADDTHLLLHVWDNALVNATATDWIDDKRFASGYKWFRWTIGEPAATEVPGQQPLGEGGSWQRIDGKLYTYGSNADFSQTTLQELTADGSLATRITVPGYSTATIRAR